MTTIPDHETDSNNLKIFGDSPIENATYFNFDTYANAICEVVLRSDNKTPLSIAINGKWGSGKTSLMMTIRKKLKETPPNTSSRKVRTVWFNAWKYSQTDFLLASLVREIFDEMGRQSVLTRRGLINKLKWYCLKIYGKADTIQQVTDLAKILTLGLGPDFKKWQKQPEYEKHRPFYDSFKQYVELVLHFFVLDKVGDHFDDSKGVLVIFIDDLDRCSPKSVSNILESINLFFDQEGCIFIFGMDLGIISKAIKSHYNEYDGFSGESYIKKMVQLQFNLPEISTQDCRNFISQELVTEDILKKYIDLIIIGSANNPRQIKQFVNSLKFIFTLKDLIEGDTRIDEELLIKWANLNSISNQFINSIKNNNNVLMSVQAYSRRNPSTDLSTWNTTFEGSFLHNIPESKRADFLREFEEYSGDEKIVKTLGYGEKVFHEGNLKSYISLSNLSPQEPKIGDVSDRLVRIEAEKDSFIIGRSIGFQGICDNCGKYVHLVAYGPGKYSPGVEIGTPEVNYRGNWKFMWSPGNSLLPGQYTIEVTDSDKSVSDEVDVRAERGAITIVAAGNQAYYIGERLKFSGTSTVGNEVYLAIRGPTLGKEFRKLDQPSITSMQDKPDSFVKVGIKGDNTWSYTWDTSKIGILLEEGTYTVYALQQPSIEDLAVIAYGTVSIIIKQPFVSATFSQSRYARGEPILISGTAFGVSHQELQIWLIGESEISQEFITANRDRSFSYSIPSSLTKKLKNGQYSVIIQHPMHNNEFDVYLDNAKQNIVSNTPKKGSIILSLKEGPFGSTATDLLVKAINNSNIDDTCTTFVLDIDEPFIQFDDIGNIPPNKKFAISAKTNLTVDDEVIIEIYSDPAKSIYKLPNLNKSGATGTIKVMKGKSGVNTLSFDLDSTGFMPDNYMVTASAQFLDVNSTTTFRIEDSSQKEKS